MAIANLQRPVYQRITKNETNFFPTGETLEKER